MQCPRCHQWNQETNRFCHQCGANLRPAPAPGHQAPHQPVPFQPPAPGHQAPHQPVPFRPPAPHPYGSPPVQPWQAQLSSRPVHLVLLVGAALCFLALFFQWEPVSASGRAVYSTRGFQYDDGSSFTWTRPEAEITYFGGGNGFEPVKLAVIAFVAGSALAFRQRPWPRWARLTLVGVAGFMGLVCLGNLLFYPGLGVILFTLGTGLVGWSAIGLLKSQP